jgi:uncharacterized protein (DUF983 family)
LLSIVPACESCGLSYIGHEQGDGPAFFGILIIGTLVSVGAAVVEIKYAPPFWVHAILWIPLIFIGSIAILRASKAAIIHAQYRVKRQDFEQP